jgi:photosystem II stability/assembly factor-like uncharacterized protein
MIATGGKVSRLLVSHDKGISWNALATPIIQGGIGTGITSFTFRNDSIGVIVGGDFQKDTLKENHVFYTQDGGKTWLTPEAATNGWRECVESIGEGQLIAVGQGGTDISADEGINWKAVKDQQGFHVIRKARKGKLILAAGKGKIARIY